MTSNVSQQPPSRKVAANLIIVCCHAIYHGGVDGNPHDEADWALQIFQRSAGFKQGEHLTFIRHIEAAFKAAANDNRSAIVFSGGCTNRDYPDLSEARSYLDAVRALGELKTWDILLEQLATDSYQNLLFSIILFRKKFGYYPSNVKVVTHDFKAPRFRDLHAQTIHWPATRFEVIGINPPFSENEMELTQQLEEIAYRSWQQDPYGRGRDLSIKRAKRLWHENFLIHVGQGIEEDHEVIDLLRFDNRQAGTLFPRNLLPWDRS